MVRTKIIATLGPASNSVTVLRKMFVKGLDVVRLNFSHGSHEEHLGRIRTVRALNRKMRRAIKIMQDLEGYRLRIGDLPSPRLLLKNESFYLTQDKGAARWPEVPFDYKGALKRIEKGSSIFIDDGRIELIVERVEKRRLKVKAIVAGALIARKGINIPGANLEFEPITAKDRGDVKVAIRERLDYVAQSFVRNGRDIKRLKAILKPMHPACALFAKVECREAVRNIDAIIDEADGIMVARGDMGICMPIYKVPILQKEIVKKCLRRKKPVIVATQMLESMTEERLPTRAEVSDVANAILDGATHLMLSGETAVGRHPARVIDMMNKVMKCAEDYSSRLEK